MVIDVKIDVNVDDVLEVVVVLHIYNQIEMGILIDVKDND